MRMRHEIRLALLTLAIIAGLALHNADGRDVATCAPCAEASVEAS